MTTDLPPIPPAVVEFAQKNDCENAMYHKVWNPNFLKFKDFDFVYQVQEKGKPENIGFILVKGKEIRFATEEEMKEIIRVYF